MKTKLFLSALLFSSITFSQGWFEQPTGLTSGTVLRGVWFVNANTGFISGGASTFRVIKKSTDGGNSWSNSYFEVDPASFLPLQFINETTGFVYGLESEVYRTTNSGTSWDLIYIGANGVNSGEFLDYNTGIICGLNYNGSNVHKTTNAGSSWTTLNTPLVGQHYLFQIFLRNANTGFLSSSSYTTSVPNILRTSDGGSNWTFVYTGTAAQSYFMIADINSDTMIAVGQAGNILRTYNGGLNWSNSTLGSYNFNNITMVNNSTAFAVAQSTIVKTSNTGDNWTVQFTPSSNLQGVFFLNELTGWACGSGGKLYKTTSGGVTGIYTGGNNHPKSFELYQNTPNPFNPKTIISYELRVTSYVQLKVFDVLGREVSLLVNSKLEAGKHEADFDGTDFTSGIYYYTLTAGSYKETKRMVLLK